MSVTHSDILADKVLTLSFLLPLTSLYTMAFKSGALKTCANKLLVYVTFNILAISLTMAQPKS